MSEPHPGSPRHRGDPASPELERIVEERLSRTSIALAPLPPWFRVGDDEVRLLRDGIQAFPAMLRAIESAQREVLVEFYWITPDVVGTRFRDALAERAAAGITVRVIYDALGSGNPPEAFWDPVREHGGEVFEYHALLPFRSTFKLQEVAQRDHRKVLVVDGALGFTGGINLGLPWLPVDEGGEGFRDLMIAVRGAGARELRTFFYRSFQRVARRSPPDDVEPTPRRARAVFVLVSQRRRRRSIHREYEVRIEAARRTIDIANAYFVPDQGLRAALYRATARGVRVRVLVPMEADVPGVGYAIEAPFDTLLRHGVEIYAMPPPMLHAKAMVVDDRFVTVGSYNLDERSWRKNHELNVGVVDSAFATHAREAFEEDLAAAKQLTLARWRERSLARRGAEWLALAVRELW